ncbi:MAG: PIN domain-containing protein [Armatimonadetes bacterium]|nr:PIN domain-containing protein [Armatimonadota bacterium]
MTEAKIFLDTNVLIYAFDVSAGKKHEIARKIVSDLWRSGLGLSSTQVLQEFFVTATRKIKKPLDAKSAEEIVRDLLKWEVVVNDGESILEAIQIHSSHGFSFWDAMIIQAASRGKATVLFSEDLSHTQTVAGIRIKNPFN